MKVLVTGGSGLIGSTIVRRLLDIGHDVGVFDIKKTKHQDCDYFDGDITDPDITKNVVKGYDIVIHLAATLGVINTETNPVRTLDTNMGGTKNVLEGCKVHGVKKIIFSSSSEVYGEPTKIPINERDKPIPITTYGVAKFAAEEYIKAYSRNFGLGYTIFRLFNVYGDEQAVDWVIPEFVSKAIQDQDIIIHGDGSQTRCFCHVSDIANAFTLALEKADGEIINVGNNSEPISIKDLALKIIKLTNSKSKLKFLPFEESKRNRNEIMKRMPDIEKARMKLDYEPVISLEEGIMKVIKKVNSN